MEKDHTINRKAKTFNDLPLEIINLIFENIKIRDLCNLISVCSCWSDVIRKIISLRLNMEKLHIINKKMINVINTNSSSDSNNEAIYEYYSIFTNLEIYYTESNYLLNNIIEDEEVIQFIIKRLKVDSLLDENSSMMSVRKISHVKFIDDVEKCCNNYKEIVWNILINITNSDSVIENEIHRSKFLQFFMNNYELYSITFYIYPSCVECTPDFQIHEELYESFEYAWCDGIIMVYPDKKIFSLHYQIRGGELNFLDSGEDRFLN